MYERKDKKRLLWLIEIFLKDRMSAEKFSAEFYNCFDLEIDYETLTELEKVLFTELGNTVGRFSEDEEDLKKYPETYFSKNQLKNQVLFIKNILDTVG